jgi:putative oxygen-independent coproporphyrinogen III oxidase
MPQDARQLPEHPPLPPLSLYVHLPWCERKCPYCDFNSYEPRSGLPEQAYVQALLKDLDAEAGLAQGRRVNRVFIGGGTPSLFSGDSIRTLLDGIRVRIELAADVEITLEANPGSVEARRFAAFHEAGVNRLSIGIQSFRDQQLRAIGRVHGRDEALRAAAIAREAGFDNLNLDLMYGLPDDDADGDGALHDLHTAIALQPQHLSWYQLTLEPETAFHRRPPPLPADDDIAAIEHRGRALLAVHGFARYEISAYARAGARCAHNLNYWTFGDYIGIGAGAHGKLTQPGSSGITRRAKVRNPRTYMIVAGDAAVVTVEHVSQPHALALEFMMNALRLTDGFDLTDFEQRTGISRDVIAAPVAEAARRGWLETDRHSISPTPAGLRFLNAVLELFVEPALERTA